MGRIGCEPFCAVYVLVSGERALNGLPQEAEQPVADVLPAPAPAQGREVEGVVQLAVGEQAGTEGSP
jgi:hypothetical protein